MTRVLLLTLLLVVGFSYWLGQDEAAFVADSTTLTVADARRREVVREVARSLEQMKLDGRALPVPGAPSAAPVEGAASWSSYASRRGMAGYLTELAAHGDSSPTGEKVQHLVALDRFGTQELPEESDRFARESFAELRRDPGATIQSIGRLLDGLPLERDRERRYLLQLASRLESVDSADPHAAESHARLVGLLREEISRGGGAGASEVTRTTASAAVMELVAMGEALPDVSELSARDPVLDEVMRGAQQLREPASSPSLPGDVNPENGRASGPATGAPGESPEPPSTEDARATRTE